LTSHPGPPTLAQENKVASKPPKELFILLGLTQNQLKCAIPVLLILGCEPDVAPVNDSKPSLYEQNQQETQNADAGTPSEPTDVADAGNTDTVDPGGTGDPVIDSDLSGCRVGDVWHVTIASTAAEGEGCQNGGGSAVMEGANQKLAVIVGDNDTLGLELIEPPPTNLSYFLITPHFEESNSACSLDVSLELGINWPNDASHNGDTTQTLLKWTYDIKATGNTISGEGVMTNRYVYFPDASDLDQSTVIDINDPCSEPLAISGSILVQ